MPSIAENAVAANAPHFTCLIQCQDCPPDGPCNVCRGREHLEVPCCPTCMGILKSAAYGPSTFIGETFCSCGRAS